MDVSSLKRTFADSRFCHSGGKVWEMPITWTVVLGAGLFFLHRGKFIFISWLREKRHF